MVDTKQIDAPVTSYGQIVSAYEAQEGVGVGGRLRPVLRRAAISALSTMWQRTGKLDNALRINRVHILNLHHIFANEEEGFRRLLRRLRPTHSFITYSEAVERILSGDIQRPYVTFSFDDGLKSCLRAAMVMREFAAKACFFICPPIIGEKDPEKVRRFCIEGMHEPVHEFMDWKDIEKLIDEGHEVGSHTMTHPNMGTLSYEQAKAELRGAMDALAKRVGPVKHFAWPFGRFDEFSATSAKAAFDCGYQSCASGVRGCHRLREKSKPRDVCLRREHIIAEWPLSHSLYFIARSAGVVVRREEMWPAGWGEVIEQ